MALIERTRITPRLCGGRLPPRADLPSGTRARWRYERAMIRGRSAAWRGWFRPERPSAEPDLMAPHREVNSGGGNRLRRRRCNGDECHAAGNRRLTTVPGPRRAVARTAVVAILIRAGLLCAQSRFVVHRHPHPRFHFHHGRCHRIAQWPTTGPLRRIRKRKQQHKHGSDDSASHSGRRFRGMMVVTYEN